MKKTGLIALTTFLALFLVGCVTKSYHARDSYGFGYSEFRTASDTFTVNFKGRGNTDSGMVLHYALQRAAELTLEHGFNYFQVISSKDHSQTVSDATWNYVHIRSLPSVNMNIKCFKEKPENIEIIDAKFFIENNQNSSGEEDIDY